jgi:hypothetical protein
VPQVRVSDLGKHEPTYPSRFVILNEVPPRRDEVKFPGHPRNLSQQRGAPHSFVKPPAVPPRSISLKTRLNQLPPHLHIIPAQFAKLENSYEKEPVSGRCRRLPILFALQLVVPLAQRRVHRFIAIASGHLPPELPFLLSAPHDHPGSRGNGGSMSETPGNELEQQPATEPSAKKPKKDNAYKTLRRAMKEKVIAESGNIAQALIDSTKEGNSNSARILVGLVDKRTSKKTFKKLTEVEGGESAAERYAREPPFEGPLDDPGPEIEDGRREPEE